MSYPARKGIDLQGQELLAVVRAGFVARQTSMAEWSRQNDIAVQNVRMALLGGWCGPKAAALIKRVKLAAGVTTEHSDQTGDSLLAPIKALKTELRKLNNTTKGSLRGPVGGQRGPKAKSPVRRAKKAAGAS